MNLKKAMVIHLSLVMVLTLFVMTDETEASGGSFGGGSGTEGDPYVIKDVWDLQNMSKDLSAHYVLGNDINASDTINWNSGAGFDPVGTSPYYPTLGKAFSGSFNGNNNTIYSLYINRSNNNYIGLFGFLDNVASVKNVRLCQSIITGNDFVGGLVGGNEGIVSDSFFIKNVVLMGRRFIGGIMGYNYRNGILSNCSSKGIVNGIGNNSIGIGGLVGCNAGKISHSKYNGSVIGKADVGGIVGENKEGKVSYCYSMGYFSGSSSVGGLIGYNAYGIITNCYMIGIVFGTTYKIGGLIGDNRGTVFGSYTFGPGPN